MTTPTLLERAIKLSRSTSFRIAWVAGGPILFGLTRPLPFVLRLPILIAWSILLAFILLDAMNKAEKSE